MAPQVICCGLSCVDMQLHACALPTTPESITQFSHASFAAGGSAPQTARALAALSVPCAASTLVGRDPHAATLRALLRAAGVHTDRVVERDSVGTALAVLPLFADGTRGCFVTLGANCAAGVDDFAPRGGEAWGAGLRVFHFGYPHLMPRLRGRALRDLFDRVREAAPSALVTMDVNGADRGETGEEGEEGAVVGPALGVVAALHANLEEACVITGLAQVGKSGALAAREIQRIARWFTARGVGIVCITCGRDGVFVGTHGGADDDDQWRESLRLSHGLESGAFVYKAAFEVAQDVAVNASGAGDSFCAGVIAELAEGRGKCGVARVADAGLMGALLRIDPSVGGEGNTDIETLLREVDGRKRLAPRESLRLHEIAGVT